LFFAASVLLSMVSLLFAYSAHMHYFVWFCSRWYP